MNSLPENTKRRLKRIPQVPSVWEGARLPIAGMMENLEPELEEHGECIIWVDGSEGFVRAMEIVRANTGPEAVVRSLLKAIETPHSPGEPARPQKVVVGDRELQFFLRGALQDLDIKVDYQPHLPLIDELWRHFQDISAQGTSNIPRELQRELDLLALDIWEQEPWALLTDQDILKIEIDRWDIENLYACVMGMLGKEYGIIFYRSLDSLKKFRSAAFNAEEEFLDAELEEAFLEQDCWFVNFNEGGEEEEFAEEALIELGGACDLEVEPLFGSIHPYEGMRPLRDREEVFPIYVALNAVRDFVDQWEEELIKEEIGELSGTYEVALETETISVKVQTMPDLTLELEEIFAEAEAGQEDKLSASTFFLKDDLIPEGSIISLTVISWDVLDNLRSKVATYVASEESLALSESELMEVEGLPVMLVQTTRPKAKSLIEKLKEEGGLKGISFNPGNDPYEDVDYDLGIIQTPKRNLYVFGQFERNHSPFYQAMRKWQKQAQKIKGYCGLLIAMGASGASRGNPQFKDMLGLFETALISSKELGLGTLTLD